MSKISKSSLALPAQAVSALSRLGENLALARLRRRESQRQWAQRIGISAPTLVRMERGDPGVGAGIYATALWMMGRVQALGEIANPEQDTGALEADVRAARHTRTRRSQASGAARLARLAREEEARQAGTVAPP